MIRLIAARLEPLDLAHYSVAQKLHHHVIDTDEQLKRRLRANQLGRLFFKSDTSAKLIAKSGFPLEWLSCAQRHQQAQAEITRLNTVMQSDKLGAHILAFSPEYHGALIDAVLRKPALPLITVNALMQLAPISAQLRVQRQAQLVTYAQHLPQMAYRALALASFAEYSSDLHPLTRNLLVQATMRSVRGLHRETILTALVPHAEKFDALQQTFLVRASARVVSDFTRAKLLHVLATHAVSYPPQLREELAEAVAKIAHRTARLKALIGFAGCSDVFSNDRQHVWLRELLNDAPIRSSSCRRAQDRALLAFARDAQHLTPSAQQRLLEIIDLVPTPQMHHEALCALNDAIPSLEPVRQHAIIERVVSQPIEELKTAALKVFAAQLGTLPVPTRRLFHSTTAELTDPYARAEILASQFGDVENCTHADLDQLICACEALPRDAISLISRNFAIHAKHLSESLQLRMLRSIQRIPNLERRSESLRDCVDELSSFVPSLHARIVADVCNVADEHRRMFLFTGFHNRVGLLDAALQEQLLDAACMQTGALQPFTFIALATGIPSYSPELRDRWMRVVCASQSSAVRASNVAATAKYLNYFTPQSRLAFIDAALSLELPRERMAVLAALNDAIRALSPADGSRVLQTIIGTDVKTQAWPEAVSTISRNFDRFSISERFQALACARIAHGDSGALDIVISHAAYFDAPLIHKWLEYIGSLGPLEQAKQFKHMAQNAHLLPNDAFASLKAAFEPAVSAPVQRLTQKD